MLLFELISFYTRRIIFSFFFCSPWFLVLFIKEKNKEKIKSTFDLCRFQKPFFSFLFCLSKKETKKDPDKRLHPFCRLVPWFSIVLLWWRTFVPWCCPSLVESYPDDNLSKLFIARFPFKDFVVLWWRTAIIKYCTFLGNLNGKVIVLSLNPSLLLSNCLEGWASEKMR